MSGLLTDLYELTMAAGYFEAGKTSEAATFEFSIRRLPRHRNFVLAAGLAQAVEYLLNLRFTPEEIGYLRGLPQFARVSSAFFDYLARFRFTGDVFAVPEGTPVFAGEPVLYVRAPIIEAQIPETAILSNVTFQTLIASKAARVVIAGAGRSVAEFGTRRAHTPEAGTLGARAAYIGGCNGTSNTLAGLRFGIPVFGTSAHSWVLSFPSEMQAFRQLQELLGEHTVQLVDTYDVLEGVSTAAKLGPPLWGIRIDSGDLVTLSRAARAILDAKGLDQTKIMVSGDLDEYKIRDLISVGAPVDAFGVGTELATSGDAPSMGSVYKLVELESGGAIRYTAKFSPDKNTLPGRKQVFRFRDHDLLALADEPPPEGGRALLRRVIVNGELIEPLPDPKALKKHAQRAIEELPPTLRELECGASFPVGRSPALERLIEQTRRDLE